MTDSMSSAQPARSFADRVKEIIETPASTEDQATAIAKLAITWPLSFKAYTERGKASIVALASYIYWQDPRELYGSYTNAEAKAALSELVGLTDPELRKVSGVLGEEGNA